MTKIWQQKSEIGRGWWAAAGRPVNWRTLPWLFRKRGQFVEVSFLRLFGVGVDWGSGLFVSVGAPGIGHAGFGWHRGYGDV
jgi:hypothetical protein